MALSFEVKYNAIDWATYKFVVAKGGIKGRWQLPTVRTNLEWIPGVDDALDFGSDYSMQDIYITGCVYDTSHALYIANLGGLRELVGLSNPHTYKKLQFGDETSGLSCYEAVYNGTFVVDPIGSCLTCKSAIVTIGFKVKKDRVAA